METSVLEKRTVPRKAGSGLPNGSTAATVRSNGEPAAAVVGAVTFRWVAAAALTRTVPVPARGPAWAMTSWLPAVFGVTANRWAPVTAGVKVNGSGSTAFGSVLVRL